MTTQGMGQNQTLLPDFLNGEISDAGLYYQVTYRWTRVI